MVTKNKGKSVGEIVAQTHYEEGYKAGEAAGKDVLIREIFEALTEWEKHQAGSYCGACEVLKPAFGVWTRIAAETQESVPRKTDTVEPPKRRRARTVG